MTDIDEPNEPQANTLCKACGLCCSGHLFIWTKLRSAELDPIEGLGVKVFRAPGQRGFSQPCPLWKGQCTVYTSPHYPRFCRTYKCKLLKELLAESTSLADALNVVEQAKEQIRGVEALLPSLSTPSFRERLVTQLEDAKAVDPEFRQKAEALMRSYEKVFGIKDLLE